MRVLEIFGNACKHTVNILKYLVVPEAQYMITLLFQNPGPNCVRFLLRRMLPAIQLYDQSFIRTAEINDVITDRMLASEFLAA